MLASIELYQVLTLVGLHLVVGILLFAMGWLLLPAKMRLPLAGMLLLVWGWSTAALVNFYLQDFGFWSWFLDPSAEKNLPALLNSALLVLVGLSALMLYWHQMDIRIVWHRYYWLLLTVLFLFLAADEYFSIHEGITFWRGGYLILGGLTALLGLVLWWRGDSSIRSPLLMFVIALGIMGVSGVVLDAFSTQNLLDIGPIKFPLLQCRGEFLGVQCRDYGNTEELMELYGASLMLLSLLTLIDICLYKTPARTARRFVFAGGGLWLVALVAWMWLLPSLEALSSTEADTIYGDISLLAYEMSESTIAAGDRLDVTLYLRANRPLNTVYSMSVHLYSRPDAVSITQDDMELGEFVYPTRAWIPGLAVRNRFRLDIPDDVATNASYQVVAILWQETPSNRILIERTVLSNLADGTTLVLDSVAAPAEDVPAIPASASYDFEAGFALAGYALPESVTVGEPVTLDFWWATSEAIDLELVQFLHWFHVDTGDFRIFDRVPFDQRFPTQDWTMDLLAHDSWTLTLPEDMPRGRYRVQTGLYEVGNLERVPVVDGDGSPVPDASIVLGEVEVR